MLKIDNAEVRARQLSKLQQLKGTRDVAAVETALDALTKAARAATAICSNSPIRAARAGATVGEISLALEKAFGRHVARCSTISGVYRKEIGDNPAVDRVQDKVAAFEKKHGRKPRILVAKMGQDGHDRGQKVIATAFADLGFDVTVGAMFQTPEEIAKLAVEHDVAHRRRLVAGRRPPDAGAGTEGRAEEARPRRHPDRRRRRHPAAGHSAAARGRRGRDLSARHGHPRGGGAAAGAAVSNARDNSLISPARSVISFVITDGETP